MLKNSKKEKKGILQPFGDGGRILRCQVSDDSDGGRDGSRCGCSDDGGGGGHISMMAVVVTSRT